MMMPAGTRPFFATTGSECVVDFERFFHRNSDALRGFLFRRLRSHEDVEDALSLTFAKAWNARDSFRGEASARTWVYQIAGRVAIDRLRLGRRRVHEVELDALPVEALDQFVDPVADPAPQIAESQRAAAVRAALGHALAGLSEDDRRLVRMHYFDERGYEEISRALGITRSQVKGRLHRIRGRLRRLLDVEEWQAVG